MLLVYRRVRWGHGFRRIRLSGPRYVKVDPEDYERLRGFKWFSVSNGNNFYVKRLAESARGGKRRLIAMHREIIEARKGMVVDHKNRDTTDNRKANLREASYAQNMINTGKMRVATSSRYKGVCRRKNRRKWRAQIKAHGRQLYLGSFEDEIDAAKAYDAAAREYYGAFAGVNFPESPGARRSRGGDGD